MRLGIGMNLQSFYFPTQPLSEIGIFDCLTTHTFASGDLMWMSMGKSLKLGRFSQVKNGG